MFFFFFLILLASGNTGVGVASLRICLSLAPFICTLRLSAFSSSLPPPQQIHEISIPTVGGSLTLGANSTPYVAQLKPGKVVVYRDEHDEGDSYVIPGGFFIVNKDGSGQSPSIHPSPSLSFFSFCYGRLTSRFSCVLFSVSLCSGGYPSAGHRSREGSCWPHSFPPLAG